MSSLGNSGTVSGRTQQAGTETQTNTPWGSSIPYLGDILSEAQRLNTLGGQSYTPWGQVANQTPDQIVYQTGVRDYVNAPGTQKFMSSGSDAIKNLMTQVGSGGALGQVGNAGAGKLAGLVTNNNLYDPGQATNQMMYGDIINPYLGKNVDAALQSQVQGFNINTLPGLRREAIGDGSYGSTRNMQTEGMAAGALDKQMTDTAGGMYQDAYNTAEGNRINALGIGSDQSITQAKLIQQIMDNASANSLASSGTSISHLPGIINAPLDLLAAQNTAGGQQFNQNQAQLDDATNRFNFDQTQPWDSLAKFAAIINSQAGLGGSSVQSGFSTMPQVSGAANAAGLGTSALGLLLSLYGKGSSTGSGGGNINPNYNVTTKQAISNSITPTFKGASV